MMDTPLGPLRDLDLKDHDVCRQVLALDKHQLIEGLVFESWFDRYLTRLGDTDDAIVAVDVDTAVVVLPDGKPGAFVWMRSSGPGVGRYLDAMAGIMRTWIVRWEGNAFTAASWADGRVGEREPLETAARRASGRTEPRRETTEAAVRDGKRINQSFWGYLSERYGDDLGERVVLSRLYLNFGLQPWFGWLWNVDRIFLDGDRLWHFEIKHKYPMDGRNGLAFGINDGEVRLMSLLTSAGLRSLHTVIVKPDWSKEAGSMYLQNDPHARERAAVIGREMTNADVQRALGTKGGMSGADTTFTGRGAVKFRTFPASTFHRFGLLGDAHATVAARILSHMRGADQPALEDAALRRLRIR